MIQNFAVFADRLALMIINVTATLSPLASIAHLEHQYFTETFKDRQHEF